MLLIIDLDSFLKLLPRLSGRRSPMVSFWVGFLFGFLGLGIYFRTFADFFIPTVISFLLIVPVVTVVAVPFIVGLYGFLRASESNQRNGYD